ncbi:MAG TPA: signal peptidase II [Sandaracinaceae bacterium LLY-WYZ-13_1]|nr:signal peptidase II [Sandaracinaceae bacterium LLY-WYZ-13_1]
MSHEGSSEPPEADAAEETRGRWSTLATVVVVGVALDQIGKQLAEAFLRGRGVVRVVDGFFELRYARNPGAFFSLGAELAPALRRTVFVVASVAAVALIVRLYARAARAQRALRWALMLLLAGALGNLVDRVLYGEVIDFVHLYWRDVFDWATFNVADALIVGGLASLVVDLFRARRADRGAAEPPTERTPSEGST